MFKNGRLLIISTILLEAWFIVLVNHQIYLAHNVEDLKRFLPFINLVVLALSVLVVFSIKRLEEGARKLIELNLLKTHLLQVEDMLGASQNQKHEHSRHIQTIQAMLYLEEADKAQEYIEGIAERYRHTGEIIHTGYPALTALLNSKRKVAEVKRIDFAFAVKCDIADISIAPWDLCSIVGNLLDNALEAALQVQTHRRVAVEIKYEHMNYAIYVYNNGPKISEEIKRQLFKEGYTTKSSEARGYGLYLVKKLVDKYEGKIDVLSGDRTAFIVYLPNRGRGEDDKSTGP